MTEVQEGQVFGQQSAPAVAPDPAMVSGPGVTQNPDASSVFDVAQIAEENARLRAELIAENERLHSALDDARAFGVSAVGLSDEDVRRIEHPEEYAAEYASLGEHQALTLQLQSLSERLDAANVLIADARAERAQLAQQASPTDPTQGSVGYTGSVTGNTFSGAATDPAVEQVEADDVTTFSDDELQAELDRRRAVAGDGD